MALLQSLHFCVIEFQQVRGLSQSLDFPPFHINSHSYFRYALPSPTVPKMSFKNFFFICSFCFPQVSEIFFSFIWFHVYFSSQTLFSDIWKSFPSKAGLRLSVNACACQHISFLGGGGGLAELLHQEAPDVGYYIFVQKISFLEKILQNSPCGVQGHLPQVYGGSLGDPRAACGLILQIPPTHFGCAPVLPPPVTQSIQRHRSWALTCCERVGHFQGEENGLQGTWLLLEQTFKQCFYSPPPPHDPLISEHSWDSEAQICLSPGTGTGTVHFIHRLSASEVLPSPFLLFHGPISLGSCLHRISFLSPVWALRGIIALLCSVGVQCYLLSAAYTLLTHFTLPLPLTPPAYSILREANVEQCQCECMRLESSMPMAIPQSGQLPDEYREKGVKYLKYD